MSARQLFAFCVVFALFVMYVSAQNATTAAPSGNTTSPVTSAPGNMTTTPSPSGTTATVSSLVTVALVTAVAAMLS